MLRPALQRTRRIMRRLRARSVVSRRMRELRRDPPATAMIMSSVRELSAKGWTKQGLALIRLAERGGADPLEIQRTRRLVPGFGGTVARPILRRAAESAGWALQPGRAAAKVEGLPGRGADVEVVVRHRLAAGRTMIRKTLLGEQPREMLAYRSGLLAGGRRWRTPRLYHLESDPTPGGRWHLFLEDLGTIERLETPASILSAAAALGAFNGSYVGDRRIATTPWLTDRVEPYRWFEELERGAGAVSGTVDPSVADRLTRILGRLAARRNELRERFLSLPMTLCHGDPTRANLAVVGDEVVLFDLGACHHGPVGSDLGGLLALPNPGVRHRRLRLEDCLTAYRREMEATAGPIDPAQVAFGFRYRLLIKSLAWQLNRLPAPFDAPVTSPAIARRAMIKRRSVEGDLDWLCDQAILLLEQ